MASLFGIDLPQTNSYTLKKAVRGTKKGSKTALYFLYSEFMLRANRNPWYKHVLKRARLTAIDGKGLHWSMWTGMKESFLPRTFSYIINTPFFVRVPIFILFFGFQLIINFFVGLITLTAKFNYSNRTKNEVVLGRDFVYDLLKIAQENNWKTLVLGGSSTSDDLTKEMINKLFPGVDLIMWNREFNSLLMRDVADEKYKNTLLNSENVCQVFPDLFDAKEFIKKEQPDLILTCLGGASGKQEFFIDNLKSDPEVSFALATGVGAAVDHLGGGQQQPLPPQWMQSLGLEWLFRLVKLPKRRGRILDSIITLWWWTTVEQFIQYGKVRDTVVNVVYKEDIKTNSYLLVDRPQVLPGDMGYSFVQGAIEHHEGIAKAGKRELGEETTIDVDKLEQKITPVRGNLELHTISLLRFLIQGAHYKASQNFVTVFEYTGSSKIMTNWENRSADWIPESQVESTLSIEKRKDWQIAQLAIEKDI